MAHASHASSEPPPSGSAAPPWGDWDEPWEAPSETFGLSAEDTPEEWGRLLRREHLLVLHGEHGAAARACVHLMFEQLRQGAWARGRATPELRTWRYVPDVEGGDGIPQEAVAKQSESSGVSDGSNEEIKQGANQGDDEDGGAGTGAEKNKIESATPQLKVPSGEHGSQTTPDDESASGQDDRKSIESLGELLARLRQPRLGRLVLVIDLMDVERPEFLHQFFENSPPCAEVRAQLVEQKVQLVVLMGLALYQGASGASDRKKQRATLRRELSECQRMLVVQQSAMQTRIRHGLTPLLNSLFSKSEAYQFVQTHFADLAQHVNWDNAQDTVMSDVVNALMRRGEIEQIATHLEAIRPRQIHAIRAVFNSLGDEWTDLLQSIQDITLRLNQIPADAEEPRARTPEIPVSCWDALPMNLIERLVERRVHTRHLKRKLQAQIDLRWWGPTPGDAITRVLDFADPVTLEEEIQRLEANQYIDLGLLQRHGVLSRVVLFLASFVESLPPCEFGAVVEFLLQLEPAAHASVDDVERGAAERHWELRCWRTDADQIMGQCGLHVVRSHAEGDGPRVKWRSPRDGERWYAYLSSRCHMFVERQLLRLQQSPFLFGASRSGLELFNLLRPALVKQASLNPDVLARQWLEHCFKLLTSPPTLSAKSGEPATAQAGQPLELLSDLQWTKRLGGILREMQLYRNLREHVQWLIQRLIYTPGAGRDRCVGILRELRGAPEFDDLAWLTRLYVNGGDGARQRVLDLWVRYGWTSAEGLSALIISSMRSRLPDAQVPLAPPSEALLALDVALVLAGRRGPHLAHVALDHHPLTQPLVSASVEEEGPPWILKALTRPEALERALRRGPEGLSSLVLLSLIPRRGDAEARTGVAIALVHRWWTELRSRMGDRFAWYSPSDWPALEGLYAGQVLVDWMLSLPPGVDGAISPFESVLLDHLLVAARSMTPAVIHVWRVHWQSMYRALQETAAILAETPKLSQAEREAIHLDLCARRDAIQRLYFHCGVNAPSAREPDHAV